MSSIDAFISYSHAADGRLAPRVQSGLQRLAKPWRQRRALRVFRDETGLSTNPHLWGSIQTAMDDSEWFVLLASPESAGSPWVQREVEYWLLTKSLDRVLVVVTDGELLCVDGGAPDPVLTTCLPPELVEALVSEPRWLDLRWAREDTQLDLRNGRFREAIADLAAPVHGIAKEDLASEDVRLQRRAVRLVRVAVGLVTVLAVLAAVTAVIAVRQRDETSRQRDLAKTNAATAQANATKAADKAAEASYQALVARSVSLTDTNRSAAMLLAVEANRRRPKSLDGTGALFTSLTTDPDFVGYLRSETEPFTAIVVDSEHDMVIAGTTDGKLVRWRLSDRQQIGEPIQIKGRGNSTRIAIGGGKVVAARTAEGGAVFDEVSGKQLATFSYSGDGAVEIVEAAVDPLPVRAVGGIESVAVNADGSLFAVGGADGRLEVRSTTDGSILSELPGRSRTESNYGFANPRWVTFAPDGLLVSAIAESADASTSTISTYRPADLSEVGVRIDAQLFGFPARHPGYDSEGFLANMVGTASGPAGSRVGQAVSSSGLTVSPDGTQLWFLESGGTHHFDRVTGQEFRTSVVGAGDASDVTEFNGCCFPGSGAVEPTTGRVFMTIGGGAEVDMWSPGVKSPGVHDRTYGTAEESNAAVGADANLLAIGSADSATVAMWGIDGKSALGNAYPLRDNTVPASFSPDGRQLLVGYFDATDSPLFRVDLSAGQTTAFAKNYGLSKAGFLLAEDEALVAAVGNGSGAEIVNATTGDPIVEQFNAYPFDSPAAIDATGRKIATSKFLVESQSLQLPALAVLDITGRELWKAPKDYDAGGIVSLAFSPDGQWLAVGTSQETDLFDIVADKGPVVIPGASFLVSFTLDGHELLVSADRLTAQRYSTDNWTPTGAPFQLEARDTVSFAARPDGLAVAVSRAHKVRLTDISTGISVGRDLTIESALDESPLISADGLKVATQNHYQQGIVVWDLDASHWPAAACLAAGRNLSKAEWVASFGDEPYRLTCEQWPANG